MFTLASIFGSLTKSLRRAKVERELAQLDDRLLTDIGISRSDIPAIARASANLNTPVSAHKALNYTYGQVA